PLVGVVIGALLAPWVTWRLQRKQSLSDSKKAEYRELLGTLGSCVHELNGLKETPPSDTFVSLTQFSAEQFDRQAKERLVLEQKIISALRNASRVFEDRIFIDEALKKEKVREKWTPLEK